jgi:carbonic anhydrase
LGAIAVQASSAFAAGGKYEEMLMACIDPRLTTFDWTYMAGRGLQDRYSQFNIAGGPIAAVAPEFAEWRKVCWDNLEITVKLHEINDVVGLVHRDCGAAAVAYGDQIKTDRTLETARLTEALKAFRGEVQQRYPKLGIRLGIMDLNGAVEAVA